MDGVADDPCMDLKQSHHSAQPAEAAPAPGGSGLESRRVARCECYAGGSGHSENSGRCYTRNWSHGITDPAAGASGAVYCVDCRKFCAQEAR